MAGQSEPAWINWAQQNGFESIFQADGTPVNWLGIDGDADIPEAEMFSNDQSSRLGQVRLRMTIIDSRFVHIQ